MIGNFSKFKKELNKHWFLYAPYRFIKSLFGVSLNYSSVTECLNSLCGIQHLGVENLRFYSNFSSAISKMNLTGSILFIDVGANDGWFARVIFRFFPNAYVLSYEPLKSQHFFLDNMKERFKNFQYRDVALGNKKGVSKITEYKTTGLSSLKEISASYEYQFDQDIVDIYDVNVIKLDDELPKYADKHNLVLKIDTQGYELEVLLGAIGFLAEAKFLFVIVELMTIHKYRDIVLYDEVFSLMHKYGYKVFDIHPSYYEDSTSRMTEFDVIFIRPNT